MQKLYIYVDESGQDTRGRLFIVATVLISDPKFKDEAPALCERIEQESKKGKIKWGKSKPSFRLDYLNRIFAEKQFHGNLRFAVFRDTNDYDQAMMASIARVLHWENVVDYTTLVFVDALSETKCQEYTRLLRKHDVRIQKIRGISKDENDALIRLADALAGFIRDALEDKSPDRKENV